MPLHIVVDQEGGRVVRLKGKGFTDLPSARCIADTGHKVRTMARDKSLEMHVAGITMNLGPVADVDTNVDNPVIGDRSFGTEPGVVIRCCHQEIEAAHEQHIQTCIKHFPGHGDTTTDSHDALPTVNKSLEELEKSELPPFEALLSVTDAIMTAHVMYPNLDPDKAGRISRKRLDESVKRIQKSKAKI